jgi:putative DNA primase/helicase
MAEIKENDVEAINRLANLTPFDFDRIRVEESNKLGILVTTLDDAVKKARNNNANSLTESIKIANIIEPWPEAVDGSELLTELSNTLKKYIILNDHLANAAALWVIFTYCIDSFDISPILHINSPEMRCGKSTLMMLLSFLSKDPINASNITPAAIFRTIASRQGTLFLDEVDTYITKTNHEYIGVINSGHTRSTAFVIRLVGQNHEPKEFSTWGAKCFAGIGDLPDTNRDRSITIKLARKTKNEKTERIRYKDESKFHVLKQKCIRFAIDHLSALKSSAPTIPDNLNDRAADNWEPLLAIADAAGGEWQKIARIAAIKISGTENDIVSINVDLLISIKKIFDSRGIDKIPSAYLQNALCADKELPWATFNDGDQITLKQISNKLRNFGIRSKDIRPPNSKNVKGYEKKCFKDAFTRYVPTTGLLSVTARQSTDGKTSDDLSCATEDNMSRIDFIG